jgi:hypothetical protein
MLCKYNITTSQVSAAHDAILNEYWSGQQQKNISKDLRPNALISLFFTDEVRGVVEQFGLQNPTVIVDQESAYCEKWFLTRSMVEPLPYRPGFKVTRAFNFFGN